MTVGIIFLAFHVVSYFKKKLCKENIVILPRPKGKSLFISYKHYIARQFADGQKNQQINSKLYKYICHILPACISQKGEKMFSNQLYKQNLNNK